MTCDEDQLCEAQGGAQQRRPEKHLPQRDVLRFGRTPKV